MIGQTVSHYKITEKLGGGGMGVVWKAEDTRLGRNVALKFLPEELQQDSAARKRFLREARSAAALDHPYICKIYEVGEVEGKSFISMEYIQGQTLKDKLAGGPLPLKDALEKATEVAEALEEAHKQGIVHRDLKPANIMLTPQGHVKVLDFGLAKRVTPVEGQEQEITTALTKQGSSLGTVPYMSPEQVRGQEVDTRSDIFSFGVVLYEMLAGVNPFSKGGHMETAKAVLSDTAPPLTRYTEDIPLLLQHTVKKMLAKEPDQRYQLVHDVRTDLDELRVTSGESEVSEDTPAATPPKRSYLWPVVAGGVAVAVLLLLVLLVPFTGTSPQEAIDSIAVLPFENQTNDADMEYLSDGIANSIISSLSQISSLKVMSSSSVRRYKGTNPDPQVVAEELGVGAVLLGRVLQPGDTLSIQVELVDTQDNTQLWGEQYSRQPDEILALQEEIAQEISQKLRLQIGGEEQAQLAKQGTKNPEAYQAYLRGQYHLAKRTADGYENAIENFNQAIEEDTAYAKAYAGLADTYFLMGTYDHLTVNETQELGLSAAEKALELDDTLAEAHAGIAQFKGIRTWDWSFAEAELKQAIELNPNFSRAHYLYANLLRINRRFDEALAEIRKAQELDPLNLAINTALGSTLLQNREYEQGIEQLQKTLAINSNWDPANSWLIKAYLYTEQYEEAIAHAERNRTPFGPDFVRHLASGNREEARKALETVSSNLSPQTLASGYAFLGEKDQVIETLAKAIDESPSNPIWANVWPEFDPLRDDPRFQDLLRRMNLLP
jgi:serine/threonine protein kinase